ncbi:MAG TPA: Rieske 2Fe-2S domain-containing protein [Xanthomonadaceae bacterium]|jgi:phenylpropionate dioxygenase-like ring-hydroxylating dioxygenase large terminal subunit|nr:Rieske 2Fe-2S domain-containing protein [Xanthomonadaceae bacterium]
MTVWPAPLSQHWFAIALSDGVRKRPLAFTLLDRPIVLARFDDSRVVAYEDRCPHRQAPLSAGCVVGNSIQCPYHGWRFDAAGALVEIPGLTESDFLPPVRAGTLQVCEHDGIVWVRKIGDADAQLPGIAYRQPSSDRRFLWSTTWQANIVDALENVLDATHTHFVHSGLVRAHANRRPTIATCNATDDGFIVNYVGSNRQSGLIYRLFESSRNLERAHFSAPGSVQFEYGYRNGCNARITLHFTPESRERTRLFVAFHIHGRWAPAWAIRSIVWPFLRKVSRQDGRMLAMQAANRAKFPDRQDAIGPLDIVRRRLDAIWNPGATWRQEGITESQQTRLML